MKKSRILAGKKILIADDIALNRLILCKIITENGGIPVVAENGRQAVDIFLASSPGEIALILTDICMPVMDGYDETQQIRCSERPDSASVPIIAVSSESRKIAYPRCMECKINLFIQKPFEISRLTRAMALLISGR